LLKPDFLVTERLYPSFPDQPPNSEQSLYLFLVFDIAVRSLPNEPVNWHKSLGVAPGRLLKLNRALGKLRMDKDPAIKKDSHESTGYLIRMCLRCEALPESSPQAGT
jgi:hypothetical protein